MDEDWALLSRWRRGDQSAANALLGRYFDILMRFFGTKVAGPEDAADLVSETMLGCIKGKDRVREGSFRCFLFAIALNKLRLYVRKRHKRKREADDFARVCATDIEDARSVTSLLSHNEEIKLLTKGLRMIPMDFQIVLELQLIEGMTGPEIAQLLSLPTATAYSRLRLGRKHLGEAIAELEKNPALVQSTLTDLEHWAQMVRRNIDTR